MSDHNCIVKKVAVLGAGVMGAQIAAHLANARVPVLLFDLPSASADKSVIALRAVSSLDQLKPAPLAGSKVARAIRAVNYEDHLAELKDCDLVIEAIAEQLESKLDLYRKVVPWLSDEALLLTNTSGLSVNALAAALPDAVRSRFCGVHFFNPPRYMHLLEMIPCRDSSARMLDQLERFLVTTLGKGVIRARDTPNFIANRIGVFAMLSTMAHAQAGGLRFDVVDDLTGVRLGRAKSATFRTLDMVGLDIFSHAVRTQSEGLADDPWSELFHLPAWYQSLVEAGALGNKSGTGIYRKQGKRILVLEPASGQYVGSGEGADDAVKALLKIPEPGERLEALRASSHPQAQFVWACLRDLFHYAAEHLSVIASSARDLDLALRWGFGWHQGPFELWQSAGWQRVAGWIDADIQAGRALSPQPLPSWVLEPGRQGVHSPEGSYAPADGRLYRHSGLDVYRRQLLPPSIGGGGAVSLGRTVFENPGVRAFTLDGQVLVVSFKTKAHAIGPEVIDGLDVALDLAEADYRALVIWQPEAPFSVGADLQSMLPAFIQQDWAGIDHAVRRFQQIAMRLRYSQVPTIAAVQGYVFGGACEFVMHCDRVVAGLESYIGLVEVGVGLLPSGGGCKELALRAAQQTRGDLIPFLRDGFMSMATARVATSAIEAQEMAYLRSSDLVVMHADELLHVALQQAACLAEAAYRPPLKGLRFPVAGRAGAATIKGHLLNLREGHFISEHDYMIAALMADVITGGDLDAGVEVDEQWMLDREREAFLLLLQHQKTQDRIASMLSTGKPLRN